MNEKIEIEVSRAEESVAAVFTFGDGRRITRSEKFRGRETLFGTVRELVSQIEHAVREEDDRYVSKR